MAAAREDADRLYRIIEDLLNISRIEAGRAQFQFRRMTPEEIVAHAVDPLRPAFAEKGLRLDVSVPAGLPAVAADPPAIGLGADQPPVQRHEVHAPRRRGPGAGRERRRVRRVQRRRHRPRHPRRSTRGRIFEKFFRIPRDTGPAGAGLGLTIAKEIVEAHGGQMDFTCPESGGTVFRFRLPAEPAHAATRAG